MTVTNFKRVDFSLGLIFILCALAILFVIPIDELYQNGRILKSGDIFRGLETLFGESAARYFLSLPFIVFGYLLMRRVSKKEAGGE